LALPVTAAAAVLVRATSMAAIGEWVADASQRALPWHGIRLDHYERTRAHHRHGIRRLKTAAFAHLDHHQRLRAVLGPA
jgi:hypothetical protein